MTLGEFFTFLGYGSGAMVFYGWARGRRLATEGMKWVALWGVAGGVLGAKITQWVIGEPAISGAILDPRAGGKSLVGGLVCGWIAVELTKRILGIRRSTGDGWALALPAGEAIGRIGCYFNGCCYGTKCDASWAIYQHGAWRHPTQLYSAIAAALIFGIVWATRDKMPREGASFRLYLLLYGASRFAIEFARARSTVWGDLSLVQLICAETAILAGLMLAWQSWKKPARGATRMMETAPVQCVNCGWEQPVEQIYCARCGCSLDAAKPLGQTWAGTFLLVILLLSAATFIGFVGIALMFFGMIEGVSFASLPIEIKAVGAALLALATGCGWEIWRLARR